MVGEIKKLMLSGIDVSVTHMEILEFFRNNPGVMDDPEGIAMRLGIDFSIASRCVSDLVSVGVLKETNVGDHRIVMLNPEYS